MDVAALYIDPKGPYPSMPGVDCWDEARDARLYRGEFPVVSHPPCAAWCQIAGVREARYGLPRGEDGGLFKAALEQLWRCGGVLEHPAYSKAWERYVLPKPKGVGWREIVGAEVWVCQVSQCAYGHRARKRTWLLYRSLSGTPPFELDWSEPYVPGSIVISGAMNHTKKPTERMWTREAKRTPQRFAELLVALARHSY